MFQASILEAMKSLRDEFQYMKKTAKMEVDQTSDSASKPGTSKQTDTLSPNTGPNTQPSKHIDSMELDEYGPSLPPRFGDAQSKNGSDPNHFSDHRSKQSKQPEQACSTRAKKAFRQKKKHKVRAKYISLSICLHLQRRISPLFM